MDKQQKIVSIIIVTYNAVKTIQHCLDSIFNQSEIAAIELIVIDGASDDGTVSVLRNNTQKIDHWISEKDSGIYDAMNKALNFVSTPRVFFLGADDILLPDFSNMLYILPTDPKAIYYANVIYKNTKHSGYITPYYQAKSGIFHQSIIYPAAIFKKYKYNVNYKIAADYALNMQCNKDPEFHFEYINFTISAYNDTGISSSTIDTEFEKDKSKLIFENFGLKIWLRYKFRILKAKLK